MTQLRIAAIAVALVVLAAVVLKLLFGAIGFLIANFFGVAVGFTAGWYVGRQERKRA